MEVNWYERTKEYQKENSKSTALRIVNRCGNMHRNIYLLTHTLIAERVIRPSLNLIMYKGKNQDVAVIIGRGSSLETLKREIELCEVRCANYHRRKTDGKGDFLEGEVRPVGFEPTTF
jgi:hypothetical protein